MPILPFLSSLPQSFLPTQNSGEPKAIKLYLSRDYKNALELFEKVLAIDEKELGSTNTETATALHNIAATCNFLGEYNKALQYEEKALGIREKILGPDHPETAQSLNIVGTAHESMGNYKKATPFFERALAINEKALGPEHPDTASIENNLAHLYNSLCSYDKALPLYEKALAVRERVFGSNAPENAQSLANLGSTLCRLGKYEKARPLLEKALQIKEKTLGVDSPDTANAMSLLGNCYSGLGDYVTAVSIHERALGMREKIHGSENEETARSIGQLADTFMHMGNFQKAISLNEKALYITEKILGSQHPQNAICANNLALSYYSGANYEKALQYFQIALSNNEATLGFENPATATTMANMADTYLLMGNQEKALNYLNKSLEIDNKNLGSDHPNTIAVMSKLASLYYVQGNYPEMLNITSKIYESDKKNLSSDHPNISLDSFNMATAEYLSGSEKLIVRDELSKAWPGLLRQLQSILLMDQNTRLSWQEENLKYELIHILTTEQLAQVILSTKGIVLDSLMEDKASINKLGINSEESTELASARRSIGKLAFSSKKEDRCEVERLKAKIDAILSTVAGNRAKVGRIRKSATITPNMVALSLPDRGILLEFLQFIDPQKKEDGGRCYGVLLLGRDGDPKFVRIDDVAAIDGSVRSLREAIAKGDEKALGDQQKVLSEKLWAQVAKSLPEGTKKLFIGQDGQLNFLSFAALPTSDGSFLAEHYDIAYVGSGRDLARKVTPSDSKSITIFADPLFDREASAFSTNALAMRSGEVDAFDKIVLPSLPGTRAEELSVADAAKAEGWSPEARLGEEASKSAIMDLKSPGILHLATHGFYLNTLPDIENNGKVKRGMKVVISETKPKSEPEIVGIGVRIDKRDGFFIIEEIVDGGPAFKEGHLKIKDKIVGVYSEAGSLEDVCNLTFDELISKIKGMEGTEIKLKIAFNSGWGTPYNIPKSFPLRIVGKTLPGMYSVRMPYDQDKTNHGFGELLNNALINAASPQ